MTSDSIIEEETNPLWMPRGSVRSLLTLMLTGAVMFMVVTERAVPEWFQLLDGAALAGYFGTRLFAPRNIQVREGTKPLTE